MLQIPQVTIVSLLSHPRTDLSEFSNLNLLIISRIKLDTSDNIHQHFCYLVKGQHRLCLYLRRCIARKVRAASIQPLYSLGNTDTFCLLFPDTSSDSGDT